MSAEVARQAFESFFTTKEMGKGTGLGLYISYNLLTEVDGSIALESQPGKGTVVVIRLPVHPKNELLIGPVEKEDGSQEIVKITRSGDSFDLIRLKECSFVPMLNGVENGDRDPQVIRRLPIEG